MPTDPQKRNVAGPAIGGTAHRGRRSAGRGVGNRGAKKGPQPIADVLAELMARRGFARVQSVAEYEAAWRQAAGPLAAQYSRVGELRRGKLEVFVANSTLMQEFSFQKVELVAKLQELLPDQGIADLRFRIGPIRD